MGIDPKRVLSAKDSEEQFNELVKENKRFILSTAYKTTHHFVTESDDEWSISLIAFREAVVSYDESKGAFKSFAAMVIKRRLLDYMKSEARHISEIPIEPESMDGDPESTEDDNITSIQSELREKNREKSEAAFHSMNNPLKDEIEAVQQLLSDYGFSFFDLTECSPKAGKTKEACAKAVCAILESEELIKTLREKKTLPVKELVTASGVKKKLLDRHRKYIIAAVEILNGEYPLLAYYMDYIKKGLGP